ncbi:hypothetical protein [Kutzneria chonburiensis]|uniref:Uncharacterized protein n=1 Tax=Kutzneria chonburiensis TaxID=1483604 RepID=A0ABV6N5N9_9PSEU|nr:hypothetical protein [Kutzneria chonburiensis]
MATFDERERRALGGLLARDQQAREARPDQALERPGLSFAEFFDMLVAGYADRLALGERATEASSPSRPTSNRGCRPARTFPISPSS